MAHVSVDVALLMQQVCFLVLRAYQQQCFLVLRAYQHMGYHSLLWQHAQYCCGISPFTTCRGPATNP
jgi:hypothetical protein